MASRRKKIQISARRAQNGTENVAEIAEFRDNLGFCTEASPLEGIQHSRNAVTVTAVTDVLIRVFGVVWGPYWSPTSAPQNSCRNRRKLQKPSKIAENAGKHDCWSLTVPSTRPRGQAVLAEPRCGIGDTPRGTKHRIGRRKRRTLRRKCRKPAEIVWNCHPCSAPCVRGAILGPAQDGSPIIPGACTAARPRDICRFRKHDG